MRVSILLLIVGLGAFLLLLASVYICKAAETEDDRWSR